MLYPQNGDHVVTIDYVTSLHPVYSRSNVRWDGAQNVHWMDLMSSSPGADSVSVLTENERKRLEAVWELFQSETVFLIDHLMVLKHVRIRSCYLSQCKAT